MMIKLLSGEDLEITISTPDLAVEIISYLDTVAGETDLLTFGANEFGLNVQEEMNYIKSVTEDENRLHIIGKINDKIVTVLNVNSPQRVRLKHVGEFGISVSKEHWGKGIGRTMIDYMLKWAYSNPILRKINLKVLQKNERAIELYEKIGFKKEGMMIKDFYLNGEYMDSYFMGLWLDDLSIKS